MSEALCPLTMDLTDSLHVMVDGTPIEMMAMHLTLNALAKRPETYRIEVTLRPYGQSKAAHTYMDRLRRHMVTNTPIRIMIDDTTYLGRFQTLQLCYADLNGVYPQELVLLATKVKDEGEDSTP